MPVYTQAVDVDMDSGEACMDSECSDHYCSKFSCHQIHITSSVQFRFAETLTLTLNPKPNSKP